MTKEEIIKQLKDFERLSLKEITLKPDGAAIRKAHISGWRIEDLNTGKTVDKSLILGGSERDWSKYNLQLRVTYTITETKEYQEEFTDCKKHLGIH